MPPSKRRQKGSEFIDWIAGRRPQGYYAFCGPEMLLKADALAAMRRSLLGETADDEGRYAVDTYGAGETPVAGISAAVSQGGLFGEDRLILIEGIEKLARGRKADRDAWLALVRRPCAHPVVLLSVQTSRELAGRAKFFNTLLASVRVVEFWKLFENDAKTWVARRARAMKMDMTDEAISHLVNHLGTDLNLLGQELEKLRLLLEGERLTLQGLRKLVQSGALGSSWECVDAILRQDVRRAIETLQGVRAEGSGSAFGFLWKLSYKTRTEMGGPAMSGRGGAGGRYARPTSGAERMRLAQLLTGCYQWERRLKGGWWLGKHDFFALEGMVIAQAIKREVSIAKNSGRSRAMESGKDPASLQ